MEDGEGKAPIDPVIAAASTVRVALAAGAERGLLFRLAQVAIPERVAVRFERRVIGRAMQRAINLPHLLCTAHSPESGSTFDRPG